MSVTDDLLQVQNYLCAPKKQYLSEVGRLTSSWIFYSAKHISQ